jgi:hypothetical protein
MAKIKEFIIEFNVGLWDFLPIFILLFIVFFMITIFVILNYTSPAKYQHKITIIKKQNNIKLKKIVKTNNEILFLMKHKNYKASKMLLKNENLLIKNLSFF